jgi:hypothetical protein
VSTRGWREADTCRPAESAPAMRAALPGCSSTREAGLKRGAYENQRKDLGGLKLMRSCLWRLAPGKTSFPLHRHNATEEALFVVSGRGKVRTDRETSSSRPTRRSTTSTTTRTRSTP